MPWHIHSEALSPLGAYVTEDTLQVEPVGGGQTSIQDQTEGKSSPSPIVGTSNAEEYILEEFYRTDDQLLKTRGYKGGWGETVTD